MSRSSRNAFRKNPLLLRSFTVTDELLSNIGEIVANCKKLVRLRIGHCKRQQPGDDARGSIWDGSSSINDEQQLEVDAENEDDVPGDEDEVEFELDPKLIAANLHELKSLQIGSGLQLVRQPHAPATLEQLVQLETLCLCPIRPGLNCDRSRDEWNLRILAQSSTALRILDLRGCYLKILSLGWLKTKQLEALHLFYQVPAASVLAKWSTSLRYLTLAKVSARYRTYRSMGPEQPGEELDACLNTLAMVDESKLEQLDLQESDFTLGPLRLLVGRCRRLTYLDTRGCRYLPANLQSRCKDSAEILELFT